jgi:outer membrane biosynthesis protein TonB
MQLEIRTMPKLGPRRLSLRHCAAAPLERLQVDYVCVRCPTARFSDEAVKAKFPGTVLLSVLVTADGAEQRTFVFYDQQAREAVRKWRFRPSVGPGAKAATVPAVVEVVFHLY